MPQSMRHSQFILTWGPGAILEGPEGPRIIPMPEIGLFFKRRRITPDDFEISDPRMSKGLLNNRRIFRLPSNAELNMDENTPLYLTKIFPEWSICVTHSVLYMRRYGCPECKRRRHKGKAGAIRFVLACSEGHLDDVNWDYIVHHRTHGRCPSPPPSYDRYYLWRGGGGSLRDIIIECPRCGASVNFGYIYARDWPCTGRFPEQEPLDSPPIRRQCSSKAKIILRQASNLRIPEIVSLFTIPPRYTRLHNILEMPAIKSALVTHKISSKEELESIIKSLRDSGLIKPGTAVEILRHPWEETREAIQDVLESGYELGYANLILEEYHALIDASINGAPPVRGPPPTSEVWFEVVKDKIRHITGPGRHVFRVVPITRLRTVIVQKGYRRINPNGKLVETWFRDRNGEEWYPGVQFLGEGVFIMLDENEGYHPSVKGNSWELWYRCYFANREASTIYHNQNSIFRDPSAKEELHPVFVWWHTLSHLLLRVLAIDSGYSSASIRERIYFESSEKGARGGIVLYTVQPGEGTMGGLLSLVNHFQKILGRATEIVETCPNDPLCIEQTFRCGTVAGAACYGCLLVSETSCEHRNMWLDRHILLEERP